MCEALGSFESNEYMYLVTRSLFAIFTYFEFQLLFPGNFFRIRSAFAFGAKRLARLLECPKENLIYEVNQFFMNTWERHGSGQRPDAPGTDLWHFRLSTPDHLSESENGRSNTAKKLNDSSLRVTDVDGTHYVASQHGNYLPGSTPRPGDLSADSHTQSQKSHGNLNSSRVPGQAARESTSNRVDGSDKDQRNLKSDRLVNDIQGRFVFARTRSSPELTEAYGDAAASQPRRNRVPESAKTQSTSARQENNNRRKNNGTDSLGSHSGRSSNDDSSSVRHAPSHLSLDVAAESVSGSNSYHQDSGFDVLNDELSSTVGTQGMLQEEQDLVNMMASTSLHGFNGQVPLPFNLASGHLPFPISPSFLASMGYAQRNLPGFLPTNIPLIDPSFSNMQFPHGLVPPPLTHYFPSTALNPSSDDAIERSNENIGSMEINSGDAESDFWQEQEVGSSSAFEPDNGNLEMLQSDNNPHSTLSGYNFVAPSWVSGGSGTRVQQKQNKEKRSSQREHHLDNFQLQDNKGSEAYYEERMSSSRFSSAPHSNSVRSRTSSESSWDGSSAKSSKSVRERRGKKVAAAESTGGYGKGKVSNQVEDDDQEWSQQSNVGADMAERNLGGQSVASFQAPRHHMPGYEDAQTSGSDSIIPMAPMLIGPGSRQRMTDNSGVIAFYPTGPPVPFLTMLPVYNIPPETGASDSSTNPYGVEEGLENNDSIQHYDTIEGLDQSDDLNSTTSFRVATSLESSEEHKPDILNSDFASHWQNLQYGRFCQNPRYPGPVMYNSPVMVPPVYLQGRFPWDGPGRPLSANLFSQLMSYGPRIVPVAPLQSVSNRPTNVYQRYGDDMPRYRSGTGTYLPNPVSIFSQSTCFSLIETFQKCSLVRAF